jgi:hypothetical protein
MVGAFYAVFAAKGLGPNLAAWLAIHGTTEIFAICISGAAGLRIGMAVAFPGRLSRMEAAVKAGRLAATAMIGVILMLAVAGILEGVGRQTIVNDGLRALIGAAMLAMWIVYFYIWPTWREASERDDDAQRVAAAKHAKALRGHVDGLAAKEYWTAFQPTPQLVVCFVPGEAFLASACGADPSLLEHAMSRRVVLATPTTLLALLRTVALTWQSEAVSGNARELFEVGSELYRRLGGLGEHASKLGRDLHRVVEDYNALVGTLERRVLVTARRMQDLQVADAALPVVTPLLESPRPLTAMELLTNQPVGQSANGVPPGRIQEIDETRDLRG